MTAYINATSSNIIADAMLVCPPTKIAPSSYEQVYMLQCDLRLYYRYYFCIVFLFQTP